MCVGVEEGSVEREVGCRLEDDNSPDEGHDDFGLKVHHFKPL